MPKGGRAKKKKYCNNPYFVEQSRLMWVKVMIGLADEAHRSLQSKRPWRVDPEKVEGRKREKIDALDNQEHLGKIIEIVKGETGTRQTPPK